MKFALIRIANVALTTWAGLITSVSALTAPTQQHNDCAHCVPIIVAHTNEGQIMDGPRGLRLITPCGPTPVDATPDGFLVYRPIPHLLHPLVGRNHLPAKIRPTTSS